MTNIKLINTLKYNTLNELSKKELTTCNGGNSTWYRFWKWLGKQVGRATIPNMETYDRDAELAALKRYGAPY